MHECYFPDVCILQFALGGRVTRVTMFICAAATRVEDADGEISFGSFNTESEKAPEPTAEPHISTRVDVHALVRGDPRFVICFAEYFISLLLKHL
eukprot:SAG11_NODE_2465_length_3324_cov_2.765964_2_plen_95_part_00